MKMKTKIQIKKKTKKTNRRVNSSPGFESDFSNQVELFEAETGASGGIGIINDNDEENVSKVTNIQIVDENNEVKDEVKSNNNLKSNNTFEGLRLRSGTIRAMNILKERETKRLKFRNSMAPRPNASAIIASADPHDAFLQLLTYVKKQKKEDWLLKKKQRVSTKSRLSEPANILLSRIEQLNGIFLFCVAFIWLLLHYILF